MTGVDSWSITPATNATADGGSINWAEGQAPSTVNNTARQMLADIRALENDRPWFQYGTGDQGAGNIAVPAVYASGTSFTIAGVDVTTKFTASRRVRAVGSSTGTIYGTISSSSFSTNTTVNVTWDSGSLSNETLVVSLSNIAVTGKPSVMAAQADYTSTTWTPAFAFNTPGTSSWAYGTQHGWYVKIGAVIIAGFTVTATPTIGTGSGALRLSGFPTAAASAAGEDGGIILSTDANLSWPASRTQLSLLLASTTIASIGALGSALSTTTVAATNMTTGAAHTISGILTYRGA